MRVETRFVGTGNTWIGNGHYRGWKVTCSRCEAVKVVTSHNGSSLPPEAIVKTLLKSGWHLGRSPEEDLCVGCRKKPKPVVKSPVKTMNSPAEYFVELRHCLMLAKEKLDAKQHHFVAGYLDTALKHLDPAVTTALILALTPPKSEPVVAKPEPKPEPKPKPQETDEDYQKWLDQLSKETE